MSSDFTTRPTLQGTFGMSASTHWQATAAAQAVLERGGNAFDAAVAGAFVLHVVEPHLNGPGGDLMAMFQTADADTPVVLNGQGAAPAGATIDHFRAQGLDRVPGAGALAAAIPGAVDSWLWLLAEHGTWELAEVLAYAIEVATKGFVVVPALSRTIAAVADLFAEHWPSSAEQWLVDGRAPEPGSWLQNLPWAGVLQDLCDTGAAAGDRVGRIEAARQYFTAGPVASRIAAFVREPHRHSTGGDHAGVLTVADLASFAPAVEEPVAVDFRGVTVFKPGFAFTGPVLLQTLSILATFEDTELDLTTAGGVHRTVEAFKLAAADRDAFYGDGPADRSPLLDPAYPATRAGVITDTASAEFRPGEPGLGKPYRPMLRTTAQDDQVLSGSAGEPTVRPTGEMRGDTCHLDVADRFGNVLSATPSGGWLQSSPTIPGLGFCLGTRLQMTWLDESSPSALQPGRRPRTTLSPTMLHQDGVVTALGTPGGDQQDQWQLLYLLRTIIGGQSPQQAIDAPMFHTDSFPSSFWPRTWAPGSLTVEGRYAESVLQELRDRGHRVTVSGDWTLGRLSMVSHDRATGRYRAAANPRGAQGYAAGR